MLCKKLVVQFCSCFYDRNILKKSLLFNFYFLRKFEVQFLPVFCLQAVQLQISFQGLKIFFFFFSLWN